MAEGDRPPTKRVKLSHDDIDRMPKEEIIQRLVEQDAHIDFLVSKTSDAPGNDTEDKIRQLQQESSRRESVLVMRLTAKEQELQEYMNQNEELKRAQNQNPAQLRSMLLDPAINLTFQRMKKELEQSKEKLVQAQNDLAAFKFTPDGQTGKRLMAKCRMLLQENSELGRIISAGRTAKLEGEIALGKKFVEEMKQSQADTDEFLVEMDEDVEGLQSTIYLLQTQLREAKDEILELRQGRERTSTEVNEGHRHTTNGSNSPDVMDTDTCGTAQDHRTTGIQITQNATNVHSPHTMETDSGVVSDSSPRTGTKTKPNNMQNGMLEVVAST